MEGTKTDLTEDELQLEKIFCCINNDGHLLENLYIMNPLDLGKNELVPIMNATSLTTREVMGTELLVLPMGDDDIYGYHFDCIEDCYDLNQVAEFTLRTKSKDIYLASIRARLTHPDYGCYNLDMSLRKATCVYGEREAIDAFFELVQSNELRFPFELHMDFENYMEDSVLYNAILQKNFYGVEKIIEYLTSVEDKEKVNKYLNEVGKANEHVIHLAARLNYSLNQIFELVRLGGDLKWISRDGNTMMHKGLKDNRSFVEDIIRHGGRKNNRGARNKKIDEDLLQLLVHLNARNEAPIFSIECLMSLFDVIDINPIIDDESSETLMHFAAKYDITGKLVEYVLLKENVTPQPFRNPQDVDILRRINKDGDTPILSAIRFGSKPNLINYMLRREHFAEMNAKAIYIDWREDIAWKLVEIRRKLEKSGVKDCTEDPNDIKEKYMSYSFYIAVKQKEKDMCRILLSKNVCPSYSPQNGKTPVMLAAEANRTDILTILKEYDADFCKPDRDGNTVWHSIAENSSTIASEYILNSMFGNNDSLHPKFIIQNKNNKEESALDIAIRKKNGQLICQFIPFFKVEFFNDHPDYLHRMWQAELYKPIMELLNQTPKKRRKYVELDQRYLDYLPKTRMYGGNTRGYTFSQSLLHKIFQGEDENLKYHPVILATVDYKISVYRWVRLLMLILYLIYLGCFFYALFVASYICGDLLAYDTSLSSISRIICEIVVVGFVLMLSNEVAEFILESLRTIQKETEEKDKVPDTDNCDEDDDDADLDDDFFDASIESSMLRKINRVSPIQFPFFKMYELPRIALGGYLKDPFNFLDSAALSFVFFWLIARVSRSELQWTFASIALSLSVIVLLKFSNTFPKLGAYVNSILTVFTTDLPRFFVILIVFFTAYIGGIHLAARQQPSSPTFSELLDNSTYIPCSSSKTFLYWFSKDQTVGYDLRRPLLSALVLFLDSGVGENEQNLFEINAIFSLVYLIFALIISVVMTNLLIAQLSKTYEKTTENSEVPYKFEIVLIAEYQSNFNSIIRYPLFKHLFKLDKVLKISKKEWRNLEKSSPLPITPNYVTDINLKIVTLENSITQQNDEIRAKINTIHSRNNQFFTEFGILKTSLETKIQSHENLTPDDQNSEASNNEDNRETPDDISLKNLKYQVKLILTQLDKVVGSIEQLEMQTKL